MKAFRSSLCLVGLIAMITGCGGSTSPSNPMPQSLSPQARVHQSGRSWMLPEARNEDLLYLTSQQDASLYIYSYPGLELTGKIAFDNTPTGLCTDKNGDVFVTMVGDITSATSYVYEYAHGGTTPIATLTDPGLGNSCAVDSLTGNLAVTNFLGDLGSFDHGNVAIYQRAQGAPTVYYYSNIYWYDWCTYDTNGDLFVDGSNEGNGQLYVAELPKGGSEFFGITLSNDASSESLQWRNGLLLVFAPTTAHGPMHIYKMQISASTATVVGKTTLRKPQWGLSQFIVQDKTVIGPSQHYSLSFWRYPKGGKSTLTMKGRRGYPWFGVAVSVAP